MCLGVSTYKALTIYSSKGQQERLELVRGAKAASQGKSRRLCAALLIEIRSPRDSSMGSDAETRLVESWLMGEVTC